MRILFITPDCEDYLSDSLLHGLRGLLGAAVIDVPKATALYRGGVGPQTYGRGFSLYGLLEDLAVDRSHIAGRLERAEFELVVFGNIHHSFGHYLALEPYLGRTRVAILDGADTPALFPYSGAYWRRPERWFLPRVHQRHPYFKRELTCKSVRDRYYRLPFPPAQLRWLDGDVHPIAFSIPEEKLLPGGAGLEKTKTFPRHVVDAELANLLDGHQTGHAFDVEADYYADLQASRFGVTTKRAGWDCLRHYEIAANGAVPCFRDLDEKEPTCAPHGLDASNAISYRSAAELLDVVDRMHPDEYAALREGALAWARRNTTVRRAEEFLTRLGQPTAGGSGRRVQPGR